MLDFLIVHNFCFFLPSFFLSSFPPRLLHKKIYKSSSVEVWCEMAASLLGRERRRAEERPLQEEFSQQRSEDRAWECYSVCDSDL
jgi:hypothetical protein